MIRRISKHNDLKDYIKSCPSGVIDDIYEIRYYIQGHPEYIIASFIKSGSELVVTLPTSQLEILPNGILMRRAFYKVIDSSYPDGYYNLEFEDCMNIWLGDYESEEPIIPEYVTEEELASELTSYATKEWVDSQQFLTSETIPSDIATQSWVSSNFLGSTALNGYATQTWVESQGYLTSHQDLSSYATQSWVSSNFLSSTALTGYATQSWVSSQQFLTSDSLSDYMTESAIENLGFATESWVLSQGYITVNEIPSGLATQSWVESYTYDKSIIAALVGKAQEDAFSEAQVWVSSQQFATQSWVSSNFLSSTALTGYATESWVQSQGYLTSHQDLTGYATESWVSSNFLSATALTGYATESWVSSNFLSSVPDTYATKSWVSSQEFATESWVSEQDFLEESKVWCGTRSQWNNMTSEEQATYKIALVTA